ncbi:MAG: hypothetical protein ACOY4K_07780 [Pseudomonadota bacterium]
MTRSLCLIAAAALTAAPAVAGDLLYPGGTMLTEDLVGKPYWAVQARCAGLYGAANNYLAARGDAAGAEAAKAEGMAFMRDAVARLMMDRKIERAAAVEALAPAVQAGRSEGARTLDAGGDGASSPFNYARSLCLDVRDVYHGAPAPG